MKGKGWNTRVHHRQTVLKVVQATVHVAIAIDSYLVSVSVATGLWYTDSVYLTFSVSV